MLALTLPAPATKPRPVHVLARRGRRVALSVCGLPLGWRASVWNFGNDADPTADCSVITCKRCAAGVVAGKSFIPTPETPDPIT